MYAKSRQSLPLSLYDTHDLSVVKSKIFASNKPVILLYRWQYCSSERFGKYSLNILNAHSLNLSSSAFLCSSRFLYSLLKRRLIINILIFSLRKSNSHLSNCVSLVFWLDFSFFFPFFVIFYKYYFTTFIMSVMSSYTPTRTIYNMFPG